MSDTLQLSPTTTTTAPERPPQAREPWADVAKGACIMLVVLWHVITKNFLQVDWHLPVPLPGAWGLLGEQLLPLRMPLFFAISGMFAVGAVGRSWRVIGRSKVAKFGYLYAVWLLIHTLVLALVPDFDTARAAGPLQLLEQLTITPSNLWYLLALAVYFTVAKAARRLPATLVLGVALALSVVVAAGLLDTPGNRGGLYQNLVFFLAGVRLRPAVEGLAHAASWRRLALLGGGYALGLVVLRLLPGTGPLVSVVAVAFGVTAAALAARSATVARVLGDIGRRTLPIYVLHMPVLAICHAVLIGPMDRADPPMQLLLAVAEPVLLTVMVTWFCLALERSLPAALVDLPSRTRRPAATG
ncbi:acyltransferase family protein [Dactylosporangium sp. NBC_01737]|uniref:acyltransferase family protein n=1 Tax=Dactylosporangium sp. NBC_01737 TaxID=2975959 RepID=UPI002E0E9BA0|nr:acyltransferase family protein [Dactylosporangium sp. NBC_01737]